MPRAVVLVAAIGVVAITGTGMMMTLRAVGWAKQVPLYLRDHPPNVSTTWNDLKDRITHTMTGDEDEEDTGIMERYRSWESRRVDPDAEEEVESTVPPPPEDFDTLEWFNVDDVLEDK